MNKQTFKVGGTLVNGERFTVTVKATNGFHAMVLAEKFKTNGIKVQSMSAVKVVAQ